mgnify:FL=1
MEITEHITTVIEQLGYTITDELNPEVLRMVPEIGYESYNKGIKYEDGTHGIVVSLPESAQKYNNGVYILHKLLGGEVVLEVLVVNTNDKGDLITKVVGDITSHINGIDLSDFATFDYVETFGYIIANTVVKPLAEALFPTDKEKQERFTMLYMPRMLAQIAYVYSGDTNTFEEGVNSEPYVLKMMIDNQTDKEANEGGTNQDDTVEAL